MIMMTRPHHGVLELEVVVNQTTGLPGCELVKVFLSTLAYKLLFVTKSAASFRLKPSLVL